MGGSRDQKGVLDSFQLRKAGLFPINEKSLVCSLFVIIAVCVSTDYIILNIKIDETNAWYTDQCWYLAHGTLTGLFAGVWI